MGPSDGSAAVIAAIDEHATMLDLLRDLAPAIARTASVVADCLAAGGHVLFCGNGGSAADAQHLAAELVGRFLKESRAFPAIALHANTSVLTALGNDYGFETIFSRQVEAHGRPGDVLVGISTSGNSSNVLRAVETARQRGLATVGLSGGSGGQLAGVCDICLSGPSPSTPRVQEGHILIGHIICGLVEDALCSEEP
jgi:D-sedoheptulose 7-phosphate isomerase